MKVQSGFSETHKGKKYSPPTYLYCKKSRKSFREEKNDSREVGAHNEERAMGMRITCVNTSDVFVLLKIPLEESRLNKDNGIVICDVGLIILVK